MTATLLQLAARSREPRAKLYLRKELRGAAHRGEATTQTLAALAAMRGRKNQQELTIADVARAMNATKPTARRWLLERGVKLQVRGNKHVVRQVDRWT
jgi:hypothetical protein